MVSEAMRMRVIRAILGWQIKKMAQRCRVAPGTVYNWENGVSAPRYESRLIIQSILRDNKIAIRPDGFPVPAADDAKAA